MDAGGFRAEGSVGNDWSVRRVVEEGIAFAGRHRAIAMKLALWYCLLVQARENGVAEVFMLLSGFFLIFSNLGTREEGTLSGYSVFNPGFQELPGTLNAARFESELRPGMNARDVQFQQRAAPPAEIVDEEDERFDADLQLALQRSLEDFERTEKAKKKGKKKGFRKRRT